MLLPILCLLSRILLLIWLLNSILKHPLNLNDSRSKIKFLAQPAIEPQDAQLTTMQLIKKYGYDGELHTVTTSDGYILELHRIKGRANSFESKTSKPVAFVMHGLMCSSSAWVLAGTNNSLGFILADAGYDVWLGNARGNMYARRHTEYSINDKKYWDFSWHEIGMYDLPAMIDYTLNTTGQQKLFYLGHSQGTTSFFVMASERPEYQDKIEIMFAMAPIAYCGRMKSPILQIISQFTNIFDKMARAFDMNEFSPSSPFRRKVKQIVCAKNSMMQAVCSNTLFLICGFNSEQLNTSLLPIIMGHVPAGSSVKQFSHYGQLIKSGSHILPGNFQQYDYGSLGNEEAYGSMTPPQYDITKIKVLVSLHYSYNDWLANVKDVEKLYGELSNPHGLYLVKDKKFNHLDYMWAKDVKKLVYDDILNIMSKFRK